MSLTLMPSFRRLVWISFAIAFGIVPATQAQRVQLPPSYGSPLSDYSPGTLPPIDSGAAASLGGIQPFDPYALPSTGIGAAAPFDAGAPLGQPGYAAPPYGATGYPAAGAPYLPTAPVAPTWPAPGITNGAPPYGGAPYGASPYGVNPYGAANPYGNAAPYGANPYGASGYGPPFRRLFQDTGFRYTRLSGGTGDELEINELEVSTTAFFPNFLRGRGPLRVTPGFAFHFLDGPSAPVTSDLPAQLYSAYLDFGWAPEFNEQFSADVSFRSGIYSDFDAFTTHSLRFMGTEIGRAHV